MIGALSSGALCVSPDPAAAYGGASPGHRRSCALRCDRRTLRTAHDV